MKNNVGQKLDVVSAWGELELAGKEIYDFKVGIITMPLNDQSVFNVKYVSNEASLGKDEVYYYQKGSIMKLKMPRVTNEVTV
ncbi:hypothetical protein RGU76_07025 [Bacillus pseudomycoides]|uniref:hypothetical protein n=1 Tax=Bacillus TaxID=1386 RepID=UPI002248B8FE|nr:MULTISPECIES: hypothetical protein [Bacillus]MCX2827442.1 hypothetical protein [Bacillus sp. DHT2]MDR4914863.1 hypothetical protein [Bacillus pseudomycoides]